MQIDVIDTLEELSKVQADWEAVYAADPESHVFLSWFWIFGWLSKIKEEWVVLAVRRGARDAGYDAFLPLQPKTEARKGGGFYNEYRMGGAEFADYYGILCHPAHEDAAIEALAAHIKGMAWTHFKFDRFYASDRRVRLLTKHFDKPKFKMQDVERFINAKTVNVNIYPYADLPGEWETYLNASLSSNTRQKARRFLKKVDEGKEFRITHADKETFSRDLESLLKFWQLKWGKEKSSRIPGILNNNRIMLSKAFDAGALVLSTFWSGERPLGAVALLLDRPKRTVRFFIGARDETFNSPPPGFVLHAHSIRWAIANGFVCYDFLMGNEEYKYMWCSKDRYVRSVTISTKTGENLGGKLDKRCLPFVFARSAELRKTGKSDEAAIALGQILDADSQHADALALLADIEAGRAHHNEAHKLYTAYLALKPQDHDAWFRMGKNAQALKDTDMAIRCYRRVAELDPSNTTVPSLLIELQFAAPRVRAVPSPVSVLAR